jgi:hypothetical protein
MRIATYLASARYLTVAQILPNGMPIPAHLMKIEKPEVKPEMEPEVPPSHIEHMPDMTNMYDAQMYDSNYVNVDYYDNGAGEMLTPETLTPETLTPETLTFEQAELSYDDFEFKSDTEMPIERSRAHYFDGMKSDDLEASNSVDFSISPIPINSELHPKRGTFNLEVALQQSRNNGYGNGVRLRFAGTSLSQVDPIYLCSKRSGDQCCEDKNPECFTPGGCFCDSSCRAFDDCCPDFEDHCSDKSCLEGLHADIVHRYLRNFRNRPDKDLPSIASGGQPKHVEPNACCAGRPFNHGLRCCCAGSVTDECPCKTEV